MSIAGIKRRAGLDSIVSGYKPAKVQETKEPHVQGSNFPLLLKKYESHLNESNRFGSQYVIERYYKINEILTPLEINAFLQSTSQFDHQKYREVTGVFVSRLIQNSFDAGYNDFQLNVTYLPETTALASQIKGTPRRPLTINIEGNMAQAAASEVDYVKMHVAGDVDSGFAHQSKHSSFLVDGDADDHCGNSLEKGSLTITGNVGKEFGQYAKSSVLTVIGRINTKRFGYQASLCFFKAPATLPPSEGLLNKVVRINPNGSEEMIHGRFNAVDKLMWRLRKCPDWR